MDLLAPILAYLGSVTAMIAAVVMSYDAFIYRPLRSTIPQHTLVVAATPSTAKAAATPATKVARPGRAAAPAGGGAAANAITAQADAAAKHREAGARNVIARRQQRRWLNRQARVSKWAYQRVPEAQGYADEFATGFGYDRLR